MSDRKIVDYEILGCKYLSSLAREIKKHIGEGWQLYGDIFRYKMLASDAASYEVYLNQAMVKYEEAEQGGEPGAVKIKDLTFQDFIDNITPPEPAKPTSDDINRYLGGCINKTTWYPYQKNLTSQYTGFNNCISCGDFYRIAQGHNCPRPEVK